MLMLKSKKIIIILALILGVSGGVIFVNKQFFTAKNNDNKEVTENSYTQKESSDEEKNEKKDSSSEKKDTNKDVHNETVSKPNDKEEDDKKKSIINNVNEKEENKQIEKENVLDSQLVFNKNIEKSNIVLSNPLDVENKKIDKEEKLIESNLRENILLKIEPKKSKLVDNNLTEVTTIKSKHREIASQKEKHREVTTKEIRVEKKSIKVESKEAKIKVEKPKEVELKEVKVEEEKSTEVESKEVKVEEEKPTEVESKEVKVEEEKPTEVESKEVKIEKEKPKEVESKEVKVEEEKPTEVESKEVKIEEEKPTEVESKEVKVDEEKPTEVESKEVKIEEKATETDTKETKPSTKKNTPVISENARMLREIADSKSNIQITKDEANKTIYTVWVKGIKPPTENDFIMDNIGPDYTVKVAPWKNGQGWYDINKEKGNSGDENLCSGAVAANMLHWWLDQNKEYVDRYLEQDSENGKGYNKVIDIRNNTTFHNQIRSDIFDLIKRCFRNRTLWTNRTLLWYINGYNMNTDRQTFLTKIDERAGFFSKVFKDTNLTDVSNVGRYDTLNIRLLQWLKEDRALGISHNTMHIANNHIITVWGASFDENGKLLGVYTTDSDDEGTNITSGVLYGMRYSKINNDSQGYARITNFNKDNVNIGPRILDLYSLSLGKEQWEKYFNENLK